MGKEKQSIPGFFRNDAVNLAVILAVIGVFMMGVNAPVVGTTLGNLACDWGIVSGDKCIVAEPTPASIADEEEEDEDRPMTFAELGICHETPSTAIRMRTKNILNTTTADYTPTQTFYIYENGGYIGSVTAVATSTFTATSPASLDCGKTYKIVPVASSTSTTYIIASDKGEVQPDGSLLYLATGATADITVKIEKKSEILHFRAFDSANTGIYKTSEASSATWVTAGTYQCTTDNSSATAVGANEIWEGYLWFKSSTSYTNAIDRNAKILMDAGASGATYWNTPKIIVDGVELQECALTADESKAYADYEWAFCYSGAVTNTHRTLYYSVQSVADPTNDMKFAFVSDGKYLSVDGETIGEASVKDDTSKTSVYTKLEVTFDLS